MQTEPCDRRSGVDPLSGRPACLPSTGPPGTRRHSGSSAGLGSVSNPDPAGGPDRPARPAQPDGLGQGPAQPCNHAPQVTPAPQGPADPRPPRTTGPGSALIGLRSTLVLVLGILVGTGADVLSYLAQRNAATGVLAGGAAFAGTVLFFRNIIAS